MLTSLIPLTFGAIANLVLWYKMWAAIQDGHVRMSPGKAIGLLFVPLFNLFWTPWVVWGFSLGYNELIQRRGIRVKRLPDKLFLGCGLLWLVSGIPLFGIVQDFAFMAAMFPLLGSPHGGAEAKVGEMLGLILLGQYAAGFALTWMVCNVINALAASHSRGGPTGS